LDVAATSVTPEQQRTWRPNLNAPRARCRRGIQIAGRADMIDA
jgi:hypothetical protein